MNLIPQDSKADRSVKILIMQRSDAKLLKRLLEHEVMNSCCFGDYDAIDTKRELLDILELFDGE